MALGILGILAGLAEGCPPGFLPGTLQHILRNVEEEGRLHQLLYLGAANTVSRPRTETGGGAEG